MQRRNSGVTIEESGIDSVAKSNHFFLQIKIPSNSEFFMFFFILVKKNRHFPRANQSINPSFRVQNASAEVSDYENSANWLG